MAATPNCKFTTYPVYCSAHALWACKSAVALFPNVIIGVEQLRAVRDSAEHGLFHETKQREDVYNSNGTSRYAGN